MGRVEQEQKAVIGIIDEDPKAGRHPKMKEYNIQSKFTKAIRLLKRKDDEAKRLVEISPYLEDWLYARAYRDSKLLRKGLPDGDLAIKHH
ncbi:MAG: hypothetical protein QME81_02245 [bacterium]|nr:hypothetical protein [bacterium]